MEMLTAFHAPKSGPFFWWQRRDEQVLQWTPGPFPSPASFGWVLAEILYHKFMNLWGIRRKQHEKNIQQHGKTEKSYEQKHENNMETTCNKNMKKTIDGFQFDPAKVVN